MAVARTDRFAICKPFQSLLRTFIELLPSRFRGGLMSEDAFQGCEAVSVVVNRSLHRSQQIVLVVGVQKSENLQRLMFAVALFRFESFQILHTRFAQLCEAFAKSLHLLFMIARRSMGRVDTSLARVTLQDHMLGDFTERAIINKQMFFCDSHRQRLAN